MDPDTQEAVGATASTADQAAPDALFQIQVDSKGGCIDRTGRVVIEPQFEAVGDFSEGLVPVMLSGKWGFVDLSGSLAIEPRFEGAGGFREGLATAV